MITDPPAEPTLDLTECDREPIHIPGAIQPHGMLLVVDADSLAVVAGAGAIETRLADPFLGRDIGELLGTATAAQLRHAVGEKRLDRKSVV